MTKTTGDIAICGIRYNNAQQAERLRVEGVEDLDVFHIDMREYLWEGLDWEAIKEILESKNQPNFRFKTF